MLWFGRSERVASSPPVITKEITMIDALFELTTEEKLARVDAALETARQSLVDATSRFEAETAETRNTIELLEAKRDELAPVTVVVEEQVETVEG